MTFFEVSISFSGKGQYLTSEQQVMPLQLYSSSLTFILLY